MTSKGSFIKGRVIMPPKEVELDNNPKTYRRDLIYNYVCSKTSTEIKTIFELENLLHLLKGHQFNEIYKKLEMGKVPNKNEMAYLKLMKETITDLHKLKHGEKHVNVGVQFKDIQEAMQKEI